MTQNPACHHPASPRLRFLRLPVRPSATGKLTGKRRYGMPLTVQGGSERTGGRPIREIRLMHLMDPSTPGPASLHSLGLPGHASLQPGLSGASQSLYGRLRAWGRHFIMDQVEAFSAI